MCPREKGGDGSAIARRALEHGVRGDFHASFHLQASRCQPFLTRAASVGPAAEEWWLAFLVPVHESDPSTKAEEKLPQERRTRRVGRRPAWIQCPFASGTQERFKVVWLALLLRRGQGSMVTARQEPTDKIK